MLVSNAAGRGVAYGLDALQQRAEMHVGPGDVVYEGMIVGENSRTNDMTVNPTKEKKLSNMRAVGHDRNILLKPARRMSLEESLEFIADDELVEVTPSQIRLRKIILKEVDRRRADRAGAAVNGGNAADRFVGWVEGHRATAWSRAPPEPAKNRWWGSLRRPTLRVFSQPKPGIPDKPWKIFRRRDGLSAARTAQLLAPVLRTSSFARASRRPIARTATRAASRSCRGRALPCSQLKTVSPETPTSLP